MNLHEYQSKQLFAKYGIPVPIGYVAANAEEAVGEARDRTGERGDVLYRRRSGTSCSAV